MKFKLKLDINPPEEFELLSVKVGAEWQDGQPGFFANDLIAVKKVDDNDSPPMAVKVTKFVEDRGFKYWIGVCDGVADLSKPKKRKVKTDSAEETKPKKKRKSKDV